MPFGRAPRRFERAIRCLLAVQHGKPVSVPRMVQEFGISLALAKRDMAELERLLPLNRERRPAPSGASDRKSVV